ncbi:MAG: flagellin FliC [Magnetococcales bacterium]|nr:flagellin FliC [Magnetococcales bacterium]
MALLINTNIGSLNAQRNLNKTTQTLGKTFERLSSGLRLNRAADDAAGLNISTRMTSQIRGFNQAMRNTNDAISLIQVTEGALEETEAALQRIRELSVQAANDTLITSDREDIWNEVAELVDEIDRIANDTEFNGQVLLGGTGTTDLSLKFQIGADAGKTIDMTVQVANASTIGVGAATVGSAGTINAMTTTAAQSHANAMMDYVDTAIGSVSDIRSYLGAMQNRLDSVIQDLGAVSQNTSNARSRIMDADIAAETATLTKASIMQQAGAAILAQANAQPQLALQLLG